MEDFWYSARELETREGRGGSRTALVTVFDSGRFFR
jgi:hypothetical protein